MTNRNALVLPDHVAVFTNTAGVTVSATSADGKVLIPSDRFDELEAMGAVVKAPRHPLDHDGDGAKGGFNNTAADTPTAAKVEVKK